MKNDADAEMREAERIAEKYRDSIRCQGHPPELVAESRRTMQLAREFVAESGEEPEERRHASAGAWKGAVDRVNERLRNARAM